VGQITSAIWSPRLKTNVGLSLIDADHWDPGTPVSVTFPNFLAALFFLLAKVRAIEYRCVFEGVSTRSLGRVSMAESPASFTVSFNDMHKTNYGGAARYARDRA
jgi:hypothetical protein